MRVLKLEGLFFEATDNITEALNVYKEILKNIPNDQVNI
jgi:hypothetical protein